MKTRKKVLWAAAVAFAIVLFLGVSQLNHGSNKSTDNSNNSDNESSATNNTLIDFSRSYSVDDDIEAEVFASYADGYYTIDDLIESADVIVKGTVSSVKEERKAGVFFSFEIKSVIKGDYKSKDTITVLTLKDQSILKEGESYILALELDSFYEETTYHVLGGYQGNFSMEGNKIKAADSKFDKEIEEIIAGEEDSSLLPLDKLSNGLSKRVNKLKDAE